MTRELLAKYASAGLDRIACNLCGADDTELIATSERFGTDIRTVGCRRCGLVYLNPRWTEQSYARFYEQDYRQLMGEGGDPPRENMLRARVHGAALLRFCGDFVPRGARVLDVGAAAGGVLRAFREGRDCECVGVEPSLEQSAFARDALGLDVLTGTLESASLADASFDLIMILQTMNHLLDPAGFLTRAHRLLKPNGKLLIEVQNYPEYILRSSEPHQVDHCFYFAPETLECMLRRSGFEPVALRVDTAASAASAHPVMWHRSASIHIHFLAERAKPDLDHPLPAAGPLLDTVRSALEAKQTGLLRKLRSLLP